MPKYFLQTATHNTWFQDGENEYNSNVVTVAETIEDAKAKIHRHWLRNVVDKDTPLKKFADLKNFADGILIHADFPQQIIFAKEEDHVTLDQVVEIEKVNYDFLTQYTHVIVVE